MHKISIKSIIRIMILIAVTGFTLLFAGCNNKGLSAGNTAPSVSEGQSESAQQVVPSEKAEESLPVSTERETQTASEETFVWAETHSVNETLQTFRYENGIELPDHNWN